MTRPARRSRETHQQAHQQTGGFFGVIWHHTDRLPLSTQEAPSSDRQPVAGQRLAERVWLSIDAAHYLVGAACLAEADFGNRRCDLPAAHLEDHRFVPLRLWQRAVSNLLAEAEMARSALTGEITETTAEQAAYAERAEAKKGS